ncbi:MAG: arylsulfatase [Acidimicrobiales bacterium]|nr:arylsulfatase [Acidimicrobiales bacterium]
MTDTEPSRAYEGFEGEIGRVYATSEPWWPDRPTAPAGAPNVIVMLCDDLGFADLGAFGSEIDTPNLDRLAGEGLRYTNFHVNPMCSPTRASLLTGLNHHLAGVATVCHRDPGFPGYAMELRDDAVTMAEVLRDAGWSTLMVGKWHLCKDSNLTEAGPRRSWPCQKGFDRFYGILDGFTNFHQPHRLYEDNHVVHVDRYPDDYYFTDDLTDQALRMVREVRSGHPTRPWFLYFAHGAVHAPLQVKADDAGKYRGRYGQGWDVVRQSRYERQLELGVIPEGAVLPPRNSEPRHGVEAWDDLTDQQHELFARYQELYAGMVDNVDQNFGRLRAALEAMGEWENTIVVFTSDNGGSREGQQDGTSSYFRTLMTHNRGDSRLDDIDADHARLDLMGGPQTLPHYPMGWAMVSGTPFRLYKINTHQGGHHVPFVISRGGGLPGGGGLRTQYQHVTDLMPTVLDMVGVDMPTTLHGTQLPAPAGTSFVPTIGDAAAASTHAEQYYEQAGHRGFYRDGWSAVTCHQRRTPFGDDVWELHDLADDITESRDLAAEHPGRLAELQEAWETAAWANQVFPLDEGTGLGYVLRPPWEAALAEPATFLPGTPTVERYRSLQFVNLRSFTVEVSLDHVAGDEGILFAHGDQGGGYAVYIEDGHVFHVHNGYGLMALTDGGTLADEVGLITLAVEAPGSLEWNATLAVDGRTVAEAPGLPQLTSMAPFEGIDIGIDRRSPVSWEVYERHGPFPYTGTLHSVTFTPGELSPDAGARWVDVLRDSGTRYE